MPGWRLRVWLTVTMTVVFTTFPLSVAGPVLWVMAIRYVMLTETLARMVGEHRRARRRLETEHAEHAVLLEQREARLMALEADLARARATQGAREETDQDRIYRRVGLHPHAPEFLVIAARRAFRMALHPDRHPRNRQRAHERYVEAEATFDRIARLRA